MREALRRKMLMEIASNQRLITLKKKIETLHVMNFCILSSKTQPFHSFLTYKSHPRQSGKSLEVFPRIVG